MSSRFNSGLLRPILLSLSWLLHNQKNKFQVCVLTGILLVWSFVGLSQAKGIEWVRMFPKIDPVNPITPAGITADPTGNVHTTGSFRRYE